MSTYAVIQATLEIPSVEQLRRAFVRVPGLTALDAPTAAKDAFGILVRNLSYDSAYVLQSSLRAEGMETEVIAESDLPGLPPTLFVNRVECTPVSLLVNDAVNRPVDIPWPQVQLVSAGCFPVIEFIEQRVEESSFQRSFGGPVDGERVVNYQRKPIHTIKAVIEIIASPKLPRMTILLERPPMFQYLKDRKSKDDTANAASFLKDMALYLPDVIWSRGALLLRESNPALMKFPSKNAFHEEMVWLLLKKGRNGR